MKIAALLVCLYVIGQAFWSYRLRHFFRIFPGLLAGLLISFTTGFLIFMNGTRGSVVRFLAEFAGGDRLAGMISRGDILDALQLLIKNETVRDLLLKVLPDSVKAAAAIGVLLCIICAVVCAVWEKPGVFLELFAYGYAVLATSIAATESSLLGAVLGIAVGALLGVLGCYISRGWIIVAPNLVNFLFLLTLLPVVAAGPGTSGSSTGIMGATGFAGLLVLPLLAAIPIGVYRQLKTTAGHKNKTAQPAAARAALKSRWAKFKAPPTAVSEAPSAQQQASPAWKETPPTGKQKFCTQCGTLLNPGSRFCVKCGHPAQIEDDTAKPV